MSTTTTSSVGVSTISTANHGSYSGISMPQEIPSAFQIFYIVVPAVGTVGNAAVVYVTLRSKALRSPCNILIALLSLGDAVQLSNNTICMLFYAKKCCFSGSATNNTIRQDLCTYLEMVPIFCSCISLVFLLNIAIDRLLSLISFYGSLIGRYPKLYLTAHIAPACAIAFSFDALVLFCIKSKERGLVGHSEAEINRTLGVDLLPFVSRH
ncbi:hypothetical protein V3C99_000803 [Haemonchus contortus]